MPMCIIITWNKRVMSARWQKLGDVTPLKNIKDRDVTTRATSRFVQDYNVLSLNTLTLGYDFKQEMIRKWGFSMLRLQFNMTDVARFLNSETGTWAVLSVCPNLQRDIEREFLNVINK